MQAKITVVIRLLNIILFPSSQLEMLVTFVRHVSNNAANITLTAAGSSLIGRISEIAGRF